MSCISSAATVVITHTTPRTVCKIQLLYDSACLVVILEAKPRDDQHFYTIIRVSSRNFISGGKLTDHVPYGHGEGRVDFTITISWGEVGSVWGGGGGLSCLGGGGSFPCAPPPLRHVMGYHYVYKNGLSSPIRTLPTLFRPCMYSVQKLNFVANGACPESSMTIGFHLTYAKMHALGC